MPSPKAMFSNLLSLGPPIKKIVVHFSNFEKSVTFSLTILINLFEGNAQVTLVFLETEAGNIANQRFYLNIYFIYIKYMLLLLLCYVTSH